MAAAKSSCSPSATSRWRLKGAPCLKRQTCKGQQQPQGVSSSLACPAPRPRPVPQALGQAEHLHAYLCSLSFCWCRGLHRVPPTDHQPQPLPPCHDRWERGGRLRHCHYFREPRRAGHGVDRGADGHCQCVPRCRLLLLRTWPRSYWLSCWQKLPACSGRETAARGCWLWTVCSDEQLAVS